MEVDSSLDSIQVLYFGGKVYGLVKIKNEKFSMVMTATFGS